MRGRIADRLFGQKSGPVLIGRFELLDSLGVGGMGVVYRGRDPKLGREVALKLLHPSLLDDARDRTRLLREAQALARLSHPNVVQLYEVGECEDGLFLAMEYVQGKPLGQWQLESDHDWALRLPFYIQAGRGLAAAHEAGLVHRDFKPSNVLVGDDGRVRVADFGLARGLGHVSGGDASPSPTTDTDSAHRGDGRSLTRTGAVVGTPAYMSPEQREQRPIDARSDQYSFCVALWEALFGTRPGPDAEDQELTAPGMPRKTANALLVILARGVRREPEQRWPNMTALLDALADAEPRNRGRGPISLAVIGALGLLGWAASPSGGPHPVCERLQHSAPRWTEVHTAALFDAAEGQPIEGRERVAASVDEAMRAYAEQWNDVASRVCTAAEDDPEVESRGTCLESLAHRFELEARIMLEEPDVLLSAHESLTYILPARMCEQQPALRDMDEQLDEDTRLALTRGRALSEAGRYEEALAILDGVLASAPDGPSVHGVRAATGRAVVLGHRGEIRLAKKEQQSAVEQAIALGNPGLQAAAWAVLSDLEGQREDYESARWSGRQCLAAAEAASSLVARADCWHAMAKAYPTAEAAEALPLAELALAARRQVYGPETLSDSEILLTIANIHADIGEQEQDAAQLDRARAIYTMERDRFLERFGPQHPTVLILSFNLALLDAAEGHYDRALVPLRKVVEGLEAAYGPTPKLGGPLVKLALLEASDGNVEAAWKSVERAIALQAELPPEHSEAGAALAFAAELAGATKEPERALGAYERLVELWGEEADGERSLSWYNVAYYRCILHGCEGARTAQEKVDRRALANSGGDLQLATDNIEAFIALAEGDLPLARTRAERVLRGLREGTASAEMQPAFEAESRWTLARVARASGDPEEALCQASRALACVADDEVTKDALERIEPELFQWIDKRKIDVTDSASWATTCERRETEGEQ